MIFIMHNSRYYELQQTFDFSFNRILNIINTETENQPQILIIKEKKV